jgi:hypothetical protein
VRRAPAGLVVTTAGEEAARDVDTRVAPQFTIALEQGPEINPFRMPKQPGCIVIFFAIDGGDAQGDIEGAAMPAETAAWWRRQ